MFVVRSENRMISRLRIRTRWSVGGGHICSAYSAVLVYHGLLYPVRAGPRPLQLGQFLLRLSHCLLALSAPDRLEVAGRFRQSSGGPLLRRTRATVVDVWILRPIAAEGSGRRPFLRMRRIARREDGTVLDLDLGVRQLPALPAAWPVVACECSGTRRVGG